MNPSCLVTNLSTHQDRSLRRIFTKGCFDHGGRLFGGFWQELSKTARFDGLVINDEDIVELDYGQMGAAHTVWYVRC